MGVEGGRIVTVDPGVDPAPGDQRLPGVVLPGFANAHSHAFHRALRGRTHDRGGTFWSWRDRMYAVAARLDPDSYLTLARAVYAEMVLAGVTCVGEFHYLHHPVGGRRYDDPNAMSEALIAQYEYGYLPPVVAVQARERFVDQQAFDRAATLTELDVQLGDAPTPVRLLLAVPNRTTAPVTGVVGGVVRGVTQTPLPLPAH